MKKTNSWATIIAALYIVFPVGIILMVNKISTEKWRMKENGNTLKVLGIVILCFIPICLICGVTGSLEVGEDMTVAGALGILTFIFGATGLAFYLLGRKYYIRGQKYDYYISLLPAQQQISLDEIARDLKITCKNVSDDLQCMIDARYMENAYIDHTRRCLIAKTVQKKMRHFVCPHCGGNNSIDYDAPVKCEYCDSPVELCSI